MRNRSGFTLVEVMVAIVVLAIGVLALTQLSLSVVVMLNRAGTKTELAAMAENRLEEIGAQGYAGISDGVRQDTVQIRGRNYSRRVTITTPGRRMRQIQVELAPLGGSGQRYSTMTYVAR